MLFNAPFNNISVILWQSVFLMEEVWVPGENHLPATSHWQTLSHNVVLSTPCLSRIRTHNFSADRNGLHTITTTSNSKNTCRNWGSLCRMYISLTFPILLNAPVLSHRVNTYSAIIAQQYSCSYVLASRIMLINRFLFQRWCQIE